MALHDVCHGLVGETDQVDAILRRRQGFGARVGKRNDLPVVAELVHLPKPRIEIVHHARILETLCHVFRPCQLRYHALEGGARKDVGEDVDDHGCPPRR